MKTMCEECGGAIQVPEDAVNGEIVSCPDCGLNYEVAEVSSDGVRLKAAEAVGEDWGE